MLFRSRGTRRPRRQARALAQVSYARTPASRWSSKGAKNSPASGNQRTTSAGSLGSPGRVAVQPRSMVDISLAAPTPQEPIPLQSNRGSLGKLPKQYHGVTSPPNGFAPSAHCQWGASVVHGSYTIAS